MPYLTLTLTENLLVINNVHTSWLSWDNFLGCQCDSVLNQNWPSRFTRHWMACLRSTWQMTFSLTTNTGWQQLWLSNVRYQELAQVWVINHSLSLDHISWKKLPFYLHDYLRKLALLGNPHRLLKTVLPRTTSPSDCCFVNYNHTYLLTYLRQISLVSFSIH